MGCCSSACRRSRRCSIQPGRWSTPAATGCRRGRDRRRAALGLRFLGSSAPKILPSGSARVSHRGLDTQRLLQIAGAIGLLILGKYLDRWFTRKPKLISYIGHVSAFTLRTDPPKPVYTHAIVVINVGRLHATNVRIGHAVLPENYQVIPTSASHRLEGTAGGPGTRFRGRGLNLLLDLRTHSVGDRSLKHCGSLGGTESVSRLDLDVGVELQKLVDNTRVGNLPLMLINCALRTRRPLMRKYPLPCQIEERRGRAFPHV